MGPVLKKKRGGKGGKRTTRGAAQTKKAPRSFAATLERAMLDRVPAEIPTYLTAAADGDAEEVLLRVWVRVVL